MYSTKLIEHDIYSADYILRHVDAYSIYSRYIGSFSIGSCMTSPLRKDRSPSFAIFRAGNLLLWKDFSINSSGNVIQFVMQYENISFNEAINLIVKDFVINTSSIKRVKKIENVISHDDNVEITFQLQDYTKKDIEYWNEYGISTAILKHFNVWSANIVVIYNKLKNTRVQLNYSVKNPIYVYQIYDKYKIYRPFNDVKAYKFLGNTTYLHIQGYKQLPQTGNLVIISKALKDIMCLNTYDIPAIAPNSESSKIPESIILDLKNRFTDVVVWYDFDYAGITNMNKLRKQYNLKYFLMPYEFRADKDISDFIKNNTNVKIKQLLNGIYSNSKKTLYQ